MPTNWINKHCPVDIDGFVGQPAAVNTLTKYLQAGRVPNITLVGAYGCGKTALATALATKVAGQSDLVLLINGGDDRGSEAVKDKLKNFCVRRSMGTKVVIIDEVDHMIPTAQQVVRSTIDTSKSVLFILTANSLDKMSHGLLNRTVVIHMQLVTVPVIVSHLATICAREGITVNRSIRARLGTIAIESCGDVRFAINSLQRQVMCLHSGDSQAVSTNYTSVGAVIGIALHSPEANEAQIQRSVTNFIRSADGCRSRLQSLVVSDSRNA